MRARSFPLLALLTPLALPILTGGLHAQQNLGLSVTTLSSTVPGIQCSYDCNDPNNTAHLNVTDGNPLTVRIYGDVNLPGIVMIGLGPAISPCPGFPLPGFGNGLQILPPNIVISFGVASVPPGARNVCAASGIAQLLSGLTVSGMPPGTVLTWQGIAFSGGTPSFTRPIEMTVL